MMGNKGKKLFRKSAIGGFNRNDVFAYIESIAGEHNAEIAKIRDELKQSAVQNIDMREKLEDAEEKLTQAQSELSDANAEIEKLTARLKEYEAMEEEFASNKSRIADLELSALARVSEIEKEAARRVEELDELGRVRYRENEEMISQKRRTAQMEMNRVMADVSSVYNRLQSEITGFNTRFDDLMANTKNSIQMLTRSTCQISANFAALEEKATKFDPEEKKEEAQEDAE